MEYDIAEFDLSRRNIPRKRKINVFPAITSVKFDGVMHEFSAISGVLEDVSEIILNLKQVRMKVAERKRPKPSRPKR